MIAETLHSGNASHRLCVACRRGIPTLLAPTAWAQCGVPALRNGMGLPFLRKAS
jgi:hypothetical protein